MKKLFLAPVLAAILFTFSCVDSDGVPAENTGTDVSTVSGLHVPAGFEWNMTRDVKAELAARHDVKVYLSLAENTTPFTSFIVSKDNDPVILNLPTHVSSLYLRYDTESGLSSPIKVPVTENSFSYRIPADSKPYAAIAAAPKKKPDYDDPMWNDPYAQQVGGVIYYPANGWGTLLFEDMWPASGDYDFNDLVVNYKVQLYTNNKNKVNMMVIGIRMKAVGGSLPYDIYLRMKGVKGGEIASMEQCYASNSGTGAEMVQLNPGNPVKDDALFRFSGLRSNGNNVPGAKYVNTERGCELGDEQLSEISYLVEFRNSIAITDVAFDHFDFFIARDEDGALKEIHRGGYEPTNLGKTVYEKYADHKNIDPGRGYYYAANGLVWALNIPDYIPHAYESIDFTKAYLNFALWAQSGGKLYTDWYTPASGNRNETMLVRK